TPRRSCSGCCARASRSRSPGRRTTLAAGWRSCRDRSGTAVIPPIVAGASRLGSVLPDGLAGRSRRERELRALDALLEAGCSAFDLAASYQLGGTERLFGEWLAS